VEPDLDSALDQVVTAAGEGDVAIGGGASLIRQALAAGRLDELVISAAPVALGAGKRLFDGFDREVELEVGQGPQLALRHPRALYGVGLAPSKGARCLVHDSRRRAASPVAVRPE
jgi:hypothetical protein